MAHYFPECEENEACICDSLTEEVLSPTWVYYDPEETNAPQ